MRLFWRRVHLIIELWSGEGDWRRTARVIIIVARRRVGDRPFPEARRQAGNLRNRHLTYPLKSSLINIWCEFSLFLD
jgi:hypothetical protein